MSLAHTNVRCHGCRYVGAMYPRPVFLEYRLPNGSTARNFRRFVWCTTCGDIEEAEEPIQTAKLSEDLARITPRPRLFGLISPRPNLFEAEEIERLNGLLSVARIRSSPPRCLTCGGTQIQDLGFEDGTSRFLHSCGSHLYQVPEDPDAPRFMFGEEVIPLDVDGHRLDR